MQILMEIHSVQQACVGFGFQHLGVLCIKKEFKGTDILIRQLCHLHAGWELRVYSSRLTFLFGDVKESLANP